MSYAGPDLLSVATEGQQRSAASALDLLAHATAGYLAVVVAALGGIGTRVNLRVLRAVGWRWR
jgi:hypothetical protein